MNDVVKTIVLVPNNTSTNNTTNNVSVENNVIKEIVFDENGNPIKSDPTDNTTSHQEIIESIAKPKEDVYTTIYLDENGEPIGDDSSLSFSEVMKSTGATIVVGYTSVSSGILKILEKINDGINYEKLSTFDGGAWVVGQIAGIFSDDVKDKIMTEREEVTNAFKKQIARDLVGEMNQEFYENTELGRTINDNSVLKHDSKTANKIQGITTFVGEIAAATGATVLSGGATAPLLLGFYAGSGDEAEEVYQEKLDTTAADEAGIVLCGVAGAAEWYAKGKFGESLINIANNIPTMIQNGSEGRKFTSLFKDLLTVQKRKRLKTYATYSWKEARRISNLIDLVGSASDTVSKSIKSNDSMGKTGAKVTVGVITNFLTNYGLEFAGYRVQNIRPSMNNIGSHNFGLMQEITHNLVDGFDSFIDGGFYETEGYDGTIDYFFDEKNKENYNGK